MNRFWHEPERGRTGDHGQAGQDGRDGRQGETGPRGPAGGKTQGDRGERGQRGKQGGSTPALRARMLMLYLVVIVLICAVAVIYQRGESGRKAFERSIVTNCELNRNNTINFNKFIDGLTARYDTSKTLSAKEKAEAVQIFRSAKGDVPVCPPDRSKP